MPDPLPYPSVSPGERISRFLIQPKWFNPRTELVSPQAFKPATPRPPSTTFRTSVYRIDSCASEEIWSLGEEYVTRKRTDGKRVLARADIHAQAILDEDLRFEPNPIPHPRHADIVQWPEKQELRLEKASVLALEAQLVLPSWSSPNP